MLVHICTNRRELCVGKGYIYGNNSIVTVNDIAENDSALLCYTNNVECCETDGLTGKGEWYFSSRTSVGTSERWR